MKTILKIYSNGDLECVGTELTESGVNSEYRFAENEITVPCIIEYPPRGIVNHFIEKESVEGWSLGGGVAPPDGNHDRTSGYINVSNWEIGTLRFFQSDKSTKKPNFRVLFYNHLNFMGLIYSDEMDKYEHGNSIVFKTLLYVKNANYIRISIDHYDNPDIKIEVGIYEGVQDVDRHHLSLLDMPLWVKDTGNPLSIFQEGIVIKGELIRGG